MGPSNRTPPPPRNRDAATAQASPATLLVDTGAGALVDYGTARLSNGATGAPALNNIFRVWYVDAAGVVVLRKDSHLDGWPDVWDHAPFQPGYGDGVR